MAYIEVANNVIIQFENENEYYAFKKTPTNCLLLLKGFVWKRKTCQFLSYNVTYDILNIIFESEFFELSKVVIKNESFSEYQSFFDLQFDFNTEKTRELFFGKSINVTKEFLSSTQEMIQKSCDFLFDYQLEGVTKMLSNLRLGYNFLCGDEMGIGKTVMSIALAKISLEQNFFDKIIVLTNLSIVDQFKSEFEKFAPNILVAKIKGKNGINSFFKKEKNNNPTKTYKETFDEFINLNEAKVFITNHELLSTLKAENNLKVSGKILVIVDEASKLKNLSSNLSKSFSKFMSINTINIILFTGTPFENHLDEFFALIKYISNNKILMSDFEKNFAIKTKYMTKKQTMYVQTDFRNHYAFNHVIKEYFIRRKLIDVKQNLPQKSEHIRVLGTDKVQIDCMKKFELLFSLYIKENDFGNMEPKDLKRMTTTICRMIASDPYTLKDSDSKIIKFGKENNIDILSDIYDDYYSPKIIEILNIAKELDVRNKKIIIFTFWSTAMKRISKVLKDNINDINIFCIDGSLSTKKRTQVINEFKDSLGGVLIATDAISYGIDFPDIDFLVEFDIPWNPAKREQRLRRIYRVVSKTDKTTIDLTTDIENYIIGVIGKKQKNFLRSVDGQENLNSSLEDKIISKGNTTEISKILKNILDQTKEIQKV